MRSPSILIALGVLTLTACASNAPAQIQASSANPGLPVPADAVALSVVRVVDGDTIIVRRDGKQVRVRLVGIDTPETVKEDTPVACFGHEASQLTKQLVTGKTLRGAYEVEHQDAYQRDLLDVWLPDGRWLQGVLVASGVARAYPYRPNTMHAQELDDLQRAARAARVGLWGHCNLYAAFPQLRR